MQPSSIFQPTSFALSIVFLCLSVFSLSSFAHGGEHSHKIEKQKAVLVTGSSSGLGLRMTQVLSANGYFVYAGVYKHSKVWRMCKRLSLTLPNKMR